MIYCKHVGYVLQYSAKKKVNTDGRKFLFLMQQQYPLYTLKFNGLFLTENYSHFYSARNARIASAVLATAIPSVRLSVRPSVTRRYCVKTAARSTVQFAPLDSKMCLVL